MPAIHAASKSAATTAGGPSSTTPGPQLAGRSPARPVPGYSALTATVHKAATNVEPYRTGREGLGSHAVCASSAPKASSRGAGGGGGAALAN
jgi:hypothetical protein